MVKSSVLRCCLKALPFLLILLYILAVVVPYIEHKEVSPEYRAAFEDRRFYGTRSGRPILTTIRMHCSAG